ncbi:hypothetical protein [Mycobacterium sp.]|uniref:hypothetical protein n=1 Tax=Mycobacterium sp. TaxID=1785 RepID=UPI00333FE34D
MRGLLATRRSTSSSSATPRGAVVSDELRNLGDLTPAQRAQLQVVTIGNAYNPDGGIFTRLEKFGDAVVVTPPRRASGR